MPVCTVNTYAVIRAVARGTVNMQSFGPAAISVAPSVDLEASKHFFKKAFACILKTFLKTFSDIIYISVHDLFLLRIAAVVAMATEI